MSEAKSVAAQGRERDAGGVELLTRRMARLIEKFGGRHGVDGFVDRVLAGEVIGWAFDRSGALIEGLTNERVASVTLDQPARRLVIGAAMGPTKTEALAGALAGRLITGLITNETTAERLLKR